MLSLARLSGDEASLQYNLPALIQVGLARLYSMQHLDGGWGWWHDEALIDEEGNPYERFSWEDYSYNNKEIRGRRVIFFHHPPEKRQDGYHLPGAHYPAGRLYGFAQRTERHV